MEERKLTLVQRFAAWLARVTAVDVGQPDDGLSQVISARGPADKSWGELSSELQGALEAWRGNPLARRLIGLITSYVVGDGIEIRSSYGPFNRYIGKLWAHPENMILMRQGDWCDELSRSGELFLVLFPAADGLHYVRAMPASRIESIDWEPGDYEAELRYHETPDSPGEEGRVWFSLRAPEASQVSDGKKVPVMLHYAVNRPVGAMRGESDLAPILNWLRRYSRWLEDRVRLNAVVRSFLWIVKVPGRMVQDKAEQYRLPPEPGSVLVMDKDSESWEAVAPDLRANDAQQDGRAIRSMVVAGGPGTGLVDIGEAETSNLATAKEMSEQRRRFLRRRQAYFGWALASLSMASWNRAQAAGLVRGRPVSWSDVVVDAPDISVQDNAELATAAKDLTTSLKDLTTLLGPSDALRRMVLRLYLKFAGEQIGETDFEEIVNAVFEGAGEPDGADQPDGSEEQDAAASSDNEGLSLGRGTVGAVLAEQEESWPAAGVREGLELRALEEIGEGLRRQAEGLQRPASAEPEAWQAWRARTPERLQDSGSILQGALASTLARAAEVGTTTALEEMAAAGVDAADVDRDALQRWAQEQGRAVGEGMNATTTAEIEALVAGYEAEVAGVEDAEAREAAAARLWLAILALFGLTRAALVGITETTNGLHQGWLGAWSGTVGALSLSASPARHPRCRCWLRIERRPGGGWQVLWMTTLDERVCPLCGPLHGMEVGGTV